MENAGRGSGHVFGVRTASAEESPAALGRRAAGPGRARPGGARYSAGSMVPKQLTCLLRRARVPSMTIIATSSKRTFMPV